MARQRDELHAPGDEQRVGTDQECIGPLFHKRRKGRIDVAICAGGDDFDLPPDRRSRRLQFRDKGLGNKRIVGIDERGKARGSRQQLTQQREPLGPKLGANVTDSGGVSARPVEAGNEANFHRVGANDEHSRESLASRAPGPQASRQC